MLSLTSPSDSEDIFHNKVMFPFYSTISPKKTVSSALSSWHFLPTDNAVSILSPVAMMHLTLDLLRMLRVGIVAGFSLFYIIRNPAKIKSFST